MRPTNPPITFSEALVLVGRRQASVLDATITLLSVRPVVAMPTSPSPMANHAVESG